MQYRETLVAIAEAAIPAGRFIPAAGEAAAAKVEQLVDGLPWPVGIGMTGLLRSVDAAAWLGHGRSFRRLPPADRLAVLERFRGGDVVRRTMLRAIVAPLKYAHFDDPALYQRLGCVYETHARPQPKPAYRAERVHARLDGDVAVDCDVVVVGTGAGGAVVGRELAEAGLAVVFVEEGAYFERKDFTGRPFERQRKMYRSGGATVAVGNSAIVLPMGKTVGGSTTVNSGTCYRAPDRVLASWRDELGLSDLGPDRMGRYFDRVEAVLGVERTRRQILGGNARVIARGCEALGLTQHGPLARNAPACDGLGTCCFGCPSDAKRSTNVSYIPLALAAGAELFTRAKVTRVITERGRATGVVATTPEGHAVTIHAKAVVIACGSIMTPITLARAGLAGSSGQLGKNLSIHPAAGVLAEFDEQILPWSGVPQGYAIEDLRDDGILFEGAMMPFEMLMTVTPLIGPELVRLAENADRMASFGFLIEDKSRGSVSEVMGQPAIRYWLGDEDVAQVKRGLDVLAKIYFAAGARRVYLPVAGFDVIDSVDELAALRRAKVRARDLDLSAYHPLGTARMGIDPSQSVVGPDHQCHDTPGLYIVDGSAVPGALGVNPQVTIMALATRAAEQIAQAVGS
ncbi:MAG TPA: GMC family oxidoreductase [Kofleriaceae bacterium]|jgi:choline dehydrogenase-like flavoprotein